MTKDVPAGKRYFEVQVQRVGPQASEARITVMVEVSTQTAGPTLAFDVIGHGGNALPHDLPKAPVPWLLMNAAIEAQESVTPEEQYAAWLQSKIGAEWRVTADPD